jgi:hypothetical protein
LREGGDVGDVVEEQIMKRNKDSEQQIRHQILVVEVVSLNSFNNLTHLLTSRDLVRCSLF